MFIYSFMNRSIAYRNKDVNSSFEDGDFEVKNLHRDISVLF
jgi:hypothetical protein